MRINVLDVFIISLQGGSVSKVDGKPTHDMTDVEGISLILGGTGRACEAESLGGVRKLVLSKQGDAFGKEDVHACDGLKC